MGIESAVNRALQTGQGTEPGSPKTRVYNSLCFLKSIQAVIEMQLNLNSDPTANTIQGYGDGRVTINGQDISRSVIVTPEQIIADWPPQSFEELEASHFDIIMELKPEIVLLGTGDRQHFPHPRLTRSLIRHRVGMEVMNTAAACRTYNIIMAEGRRVAAALLMI